MIPKELQDLMTMLAGAPCVVVPVGNGPLDFSKLAGIMGTPKGYFISKFLNTHPRGPFVSRKIEEDLRPMGGPGPMIFAVENKGKGDLGQSYRDYLSSRIRQGRLAPSNIGKWEDLEGAAQRMLERINLF